MRRWFLEVVEVTAQKERSFGCETFAGWAVAASGIDHDRVDAVVDNVYDESPPVTDRLIENDLQDIAFVRISLGPQETCFGFRETSRAVFIDLVRFMQQTSPNTSLQGLGDW